MQAVGLPRTQSSLKVAPNSSSFMCAKSYRRYTSLARLKKNSSKAFIARGRSGSVTRLKAICVKKRLRSRNGNKLELVGEYPRPVRNEMIPGEGYVRITACDR